MHLEVIALGLDILSGSFIQAGETDWQQWLLMFSWPRYLVD